MRVYVTINEARRNPGNAWNSIETVCTRMDRNQVEVKHEFAN